MILLISFYFPYTWLLMSLLNLLFNKQAHLHNLQHLTILFYLFVLICRCFLSCCHMLSHVVTMVTWVCFHHWWAEPLIYILYCNSWCVVICDSFKSVKVKMCFYGCSSQDTDWINTTPTWQTANIIELLSVDTQTKKDLPLVLLRIHTLF